MVRYSKLAHRGVPVSHNVIERYLKNSNRIDLRPEDVDEIISRRRFAANSQGSEGKGGGVKKSRERQRHLSPHELLGPLAKALTDERPEIAFPRLLMGKMCGEFLQEINRECGPVVDEHFELKNEKKSCIKTVVAGMFALAVVDKENGRELFQKAAGIVEEMVALGQGSMSLDSMVEEFGMSRAALGEVIASSKLVEGF